MKLRTRNEWKKILTKLAINLYTCRKYYVEDLMEKEEKVIVITDEDIQIKMEFTDY